MMSSLEVGIVKYTRQYISDLLRLKTKVQREVWYNNIIVEGSGCYTCKNSPNQDGYLRVGYYDKVRGKNRSIMAHVLVWEALNGPKPEDMEINHKCSNRACFNPEHLELMDGSDHASHTNINRVGYIMNRCTDEELVDYYYKVKYKGVPINQIVRDHGIKRSTLSSIMNKRSRAKATNAVDEWVGALSKLF